MRDMVQFYVDKAGDHRWRRLASNGRIVADSGEGYRNSGDAEDEARKIFGDTVDYVKVGENGT